MMIVILVITIFFMFAYAKELRRRDNFDDYMSVWLNEVGDNETERDILECLIKEFRR